jgi:hypothetical protein
MDQPFEIKKKPRTLKECLKSSSFLRPLIGVVLGGAGGYLYYHFIGCSSGSCAITGNPYISTLAGGFLGFFTLKSPGAQC